MQPQIAPIETEHIRDLLNTFRERHGITSDEKLGAALGVNKQAIYRWRRGEIDKSARVLAALVLDLVSAHVDIPS
jgi:transcriptional regulator with XRE-family HTH domain